MSRRLKIEWCHDLPPAARKLASSRTAEMILHYGRNITAMNIDTLAACCYLQGIEDCFEFYRRRSRQQLGKLT